MTQSSLTPLRPRHSAAWLGGSLVILALLGLHGCQGKPSADPSPSTATTSKNRVNDELMHHAIDALYRLEEFEGNEMLQRTLDRLNQWVQNQKPIADWKPDPMLATLPAPLADPPLLKELDQLRFGAADGFALQEAVCLRNAAAWATGSDIDQLTRTKALFDWTVRNIQIQPDRPSSDEAEHILQTPWETLLLGRGTAWERAWVFVLLARQQGLDAIVLGLPDAASPDAVTPWAVAVLREGQWDLFDPTLGLAIPGPEGIRLNDDGQLDLQPATLAQLVADPQLLRQLDADAEHPYPVKAEQLSQVVALLEASPAYLQEKMALIEARLVGSERMVLTASPSAQAQRVQATQQLREVRLWTLPFEQLAQRQRLGEQAVQWQQTVFAPLQIGQTPVLWKGRLLHLKGVFSDEHDAAHYYQLARPSNRELDDASVPPQVKVIFQQAKHDASYWLGLIAQHQANYRAAIDYLANRTLLVQENGPWTRGIRYNLGRIYEAQHEYAKAIESYRLLSTSPDAHGNLLRAHWLQTLASDRGSQPTTAEGPTEPAAKPASTLPALPTLPTLPEEPAAEAPAPSPQ